MSESHNDFGEATFDLWLDWQTQPWGRLYYSTTRLNLQRHIGNKKLRILDVGGGNGFDSIYFAKQGHEVTLIDSSSLMLAEANKLVEQEGLAAQITFCQTDANALASYLNEQRFDLILCHLMLEFVENTQALLRDLCQLLEPDGLLSVVDPNRFSQVHQYAFYSGDLKSAAARIGARDYAHPWVKRNVPEFSAQEIIEELKESRCDLAGQYGISCLCSWLPNERKFEDEYYAELEQLEHRLTDTYPYYLLARFYQVIGRKQ
jgi:S-adenosylmethionine-dependent methyltransferase